LRDIADEKRPRAEPPAVCRPARADPEHLEYWFSACLRAAQSVYYVLAETGGKDFKAAQSRWRASLPEPNRSNFGPMIGMRGKDVHLATTGAEAPALAKALEPYIAGTRYRAVMR
jgi:hypothetical protein